MGIVFEECHFVKCYLFVYFSFGCTESSVAAQRLSLAAESGASRAQASRVVPCLVAERGL